MKVAPVLTFSVPFGGTTAKRHGALPRDATDDRRGERRDRLRHGDGARRRSGDCVADRPSLPPTGSRIRLDVHVPATSSAGRWRKRPASGAQQGRQHNANHQRGHHHGTGVQSGRGRRRGPAMATSGATCVVRRERMPLRLRRDRDRLPDRRGVSERRRHTGDVAPSWSDDDGRMGIDSATIRGPFPQVKSFPGGPRLVAVGPRVEKPRTSSAGRTAGRLEATRCGQTAAALGARTAWASGVTRGAKFAQLVRVRRAAIFILSALVGTASCGGPANGPASPEELDVGRGPRRPPAPRSGSPSDSSTSATVSPKYHLPSPSPRRRPARQSTRTSRGSVRRRGISRAASSRPPRPASSSASGRTSCASGAESCDTHYLDSERAGADAAPRSPLPT